ncbi:hypothetical protein KCN56_01830 [Photobacterium galatheae]|uniref:toxin-antitoxin system YwqK family antitoxin n=1 Tax=Photobacterium galatheae TaxID=1654360 RepID=UPI00202CAA2A|nr:hypothetical protein [Photobacterium galatheae]MCM0147306.1 hypothetical protein [Photobacterium galatheae]
MNVLRVLTLSLLIPLSVSAAELKKYHRQDGSLWQTIEMQDGQKHGWHRTYYRDGQLKSEIPYLNGKRHGTGTLFKTNGDLARQITYADGAFHGLFTDFYDENAIRNQTQYQHGKKQGWDRIYPKPERYYELSPERVLYEGNYVDGVQHGWERAFIAPSYSDHEGLGRLLYERYFENGQKHGWERHYAKEKLKDGRNKDALTEEVYFQHGKREGTSWSFTRRYCTENIYKDDQLNGTTRRYERDDEGECEHLTSTTQFVGGKRHGEARSYDDDGQLTSIIRYQEGEKNGISEEFRYGYLALKTPYVDGERHGLVEGFDSKGRHTLKAHYVKGKKHGIEEQISFDRHVYQLSRVTYVDGQRQGEMRNYQKERVDRLLTYLSDAEKREFNYESHASLTGILNYQDDKLHGEQRHFYENGDLKEESHYVEGKRHGDFVTYNQNGTLSEQAHYIHGQPHGLLEAYNSAGFPKRLANYDHGKFHGDVIEFSTRSPVVVSEAHYNQGTLVGFNRRFHERTGKLLVERDLDNDVVRYFYPDGSLKAEVHRQGKKVLSGVHFDHMGNQLPTKENTFERRYR